MRNYMIKNATVFEGTNVRGKYHWVIAELWDYEHPELNKDVPYAMVITNEEQALKFLKCSTAINDPNDRRFSATVKGFKFDLTAAITAIKNKKFADGTPCCNQSFDVATMEFKEVPDNFILKPNVDIIEVPLKGEWCRIARHDAEVTLRSGQKLQIKAGRPLVGKNGSITPVTKLYVPMQFGPDGKMIESLEDTTNRILESGYAPMNASPTNAPAAATAEETQHKEDAATEAAAAAAATALGGISLS